MARPTFNDISDSDLDVDSPGKETTVFQQLRDNAYAVRIVLISVDQSSVAFSGVGYQTLYTIALHIPDVNDYSALTRTFRHRFEVQGPTSGVATVRIQDSASGTNSTEFSNSTTSFSTADLTIDLDSIGSVQGTDRTINVQGKLSAGASGNGAVRADKRYDSYLEY